MADSKAHYYVMDSGMLNNAIKGYLESAMLDTSLTEEQKQEVREGLRYSLEVMSSEEAEANYLRR